MPFYSKDISLSYKVIQNPIVSSHQKLKYLFLNLLISCQIDLKKNHLIIINLRANFRFNTHTHFFFGSKNLIVQVKNEKIFMPFVVHCSLKISIRKSIVHMSLKISLVVDRFVVALISLIKT